MDKSRRLANCVALVLLAACSSTPIIYAPGDKTTDSASGSVTRLSELLKTAETPVTAVFVHGVVDHCAGYALDEKDGWLNQRAMAALGLVRVPLDKAAVHPINLNVFMSGPPDSQAKVQYEIKNYTWTVPSITKPIALQAIEITWSDLTHWIKTDQLGYDSPSVFESAADMMKACILPPDSTVVPPIKNPPARLALDRLAKETVLDRDLADALIYAGNYGQVIERGVAEALCHAVSTQAVDTQKCKWPEASKPRGEGRHYLFVTHSSGGRILYDLLINLTRHDTESKPNPFSDDELKSAFPFVSQMLASTPAIYMMANQLSLLGLANLDTDVRTSTAPVPYLEFAPNATTAAKAARPGAGRDGREHHRDVLPTLGAARAEAIAALPEDQKGGPPAALLHIIAFNDTNDLLTWHIPSWYGKIDSDANRTSANIDIANKAVRDVIYCGARNGVLVSCDLTQ